MANFLRMLFGVLLLPFCWGLSRTFIDALIKSANAGEMLSAEMISLFAGMAAFALCWATISHPVRTYVLGHELTHAIWGLLFGARPSDVHVSENGGSVSLTKSNFIITLAPYFFPFYTFVVIVVALITYAFVRPLPCMPIWMFAIGFTWAFHVLFTLETLTQSQPDVKLYGRIFSWAIIYIVNLAFVLVWLSTMTTFSFSELWTSLVLRTGSAYTGVAVTLSDWCKWAYSLCRK